MQHWGASLRHMWGGGYPSLGTVPDYSLNFVILFWISVCIHLKGLSPQMPAGRSPAGKGSTAPVATNAQRRTFADANTSLSSSKQCLRLKWWCSRGCPAAVRSTEPGVSFGIGKGFSCPEVLSNTLCLRAESRGEGGWTTMLLNRLLLTLYSICTLTEANQPLREVQRIFSARKVCHFPAGKFSCS